MQKLVEKYKSYIEPKSIELIKKCLIISGITCLLSVLLSGIYNTFYISHFLYDASLIIFRTGLMIGLFPTAFALVIGKHKKDQNL